MSLPVTSCLRCPWMKWGKGGMRCSSVYVLPIRTTRLIQNGNYGKNLTKIKSCAEWDVADVKSAELA